MDTCGRSDTAALRSLQVARRTSKKAILGVIGLDDEAGVLAEAGRVLRRHRVPLVVATPRAAEAEAAAEAQLIMGDYPSELQPDNVFSAVPNTAAIARATVAVAKGIRSPSVRLLGTCWRTLRAAERAARQLGVRLASPSRHFLTDFSGDVSAFLESLQADPALAPVALLMEPDELTNFMAQAVKKATGRRVTWLLGSVAGSISPQLAATWALDLSSSAFLVEPHLSELAGLSAFMESHGIASHPLDDKVPHIVQAVSALAAAFHLQELSTCVPDGRTASNFTCGLRADPSSVPSRMLSSLRQLSLPPSAHQDAAAAAPARQLEGTSNHFTPNGRLVAHKYLVNKLMAGSGESSPVAWYSDDDGLVLAAIMTSGSRFDFFGHASSGPLLSPVQPFAGAEEDSGTDVVVSSPGGQETDNEIIVQMAPSPSSAGPLAGRLDLMQGHGRTWAASILAVAATEFLAVLYILVVHLARCWDGTIPRPASQSLSFLLMLVLLAQLASGAACYVLPGLLPARLKAILPPVLLVAGYSILLVKLLRYRLLDSAGLGGSVPQFPLYLAIALSVSVQAVLGSLLPEGESILVLFSYLCALTVLTTGYALYLRKVRAGHAEAQLVAVGSLVSSGLLLSWCTSVWAADDPRYDDALAAALVVLLTAAVLGSVLIPKTVRLSSSSKQSKSPAPALRPRLASHHTNPNISIVSNSPWLDYTLSHKAHQHQHHQHRLHF